MKKNKFFAGVIVLLFVLSFSVSQVVLAQKSIEVCECVGAGNSGRWRQVMLDCGVQAEVCLISGNGNACKPLGSQTREC